MRRSQRAIRRIASLVVTVGLVGVSAVTLAGCTAADARIPAIEEAIRSAAADATPYLIGVQAGDVAQALSEAGDATTVMVPVLAPDLSTAKATVTAEPVGEQDYFLDVADAAKLLAGAGETAWRTWLNANRQSVEYIETSIPVTLAGEGEKTTAAVDKDALRTFASTLETMNVGLFVRTAAELPQWRMTMAFAHAPEVLSELTGLDESRVTAGLAEVGGVASAADGQFTIVAKYADLNDLAAQASERVVESYGTGKIWGGVSKDDFESKLDAAAERLSPGFPLSRQKDAIAALVTEGDELIDASAALQENLAAQVSRYRLELQPGSFAADTDTDEAWTKAVDGGVKKLSKQVVKEQKRPGTKRLLAGTSGQSITIETGSRTDRHVTFFKWNSSEQVVSAFIRAGKSITLKVPTGNYRLVYASGDAWYGEKYSFGPDGKYREFKTDSNASGPMKISIKSGYTYTISIEVSGAAVGGAVPWGSTDNPFEE
jgi:hypothetical protein